MAEGELRTGQQPGLAGRRRDGLPGSEGEHELQRRMGTSARAEQFYREQLLDHLNPRMQEFTRQQEMFFLATADAEGACDCSFRAGPPGFLHVVDAYTVVYPEYRGNGVHASLGNLLENPQLGLILVDFVRARIGLHINGRGTVLSDAELRAELPSLPVDPVPGRQTELWVRVTVEEAYIHCAKHIPHLQKAPGRPARDWGTDDYKRKGGDFFGAARAAGHQPPQRREEVSAAGAHGGDDVQEGVRPGTSAPELLETATAQPDAQAPGLAAVAAAGAVGQDETQSEPSPDAGFPTSAAPAEHPPADATMALRRSDLPPLPDAESSASSVAPLATPTEGAALGTTPNSAPEPVEASEAPEASGAAHARHARVDPDWLHHAQQALAEAQRRGVQARESEQATFHGWFG